MFFLRRDSSRSGDPQLLACLLIYWAIRVRLEIVRGAQEPSQRLDTKYRPHLYIYIRIMPFYRLASGGPVARQSWEADVPPLRAPRAGPSTPAPSLFFPPARPTSGFYVKLCRPVPPVSRLFVCVSEGTGAKEVITARSPRLASGQSK